ncbi:MAG: nicotinate-nucleotide--dimethylbenzimidazole phosphoribosyltransferase [Bacteroidales bacterium]|nr:nicotinate-nucleotide--dimethylbenzimidazole phosphoribosyltransferase [Bacteroidales bacterium]
MNLIQKIQKKIDQKTKPLGALGKLEEIALKISLIQNSLNPELKRPVHLVFAGDHGLADEGVSLYPKEVTAQMVFNFLNGGAAINVFCRQHNIDLKVVDAGVDYDFENNPEIIHRKIAHGTRNILKAPAMTIEQCHQAMKTGKELVQNEYLKGTNIISFGEMGIGNTSSASLLLHKYANIPIEDCVGAGTGLDNEQINKKIAVLKKAAEKYHPVLAEEILTYFGGFEIAMMTGAILEAKENAMTIIVDGFIATSALLAAYKIKPEVLDNCIFSHQSNEKAHKLMLEYLGADALLNLNLRLGEGTGAVLAYPIIESAILFLNEMASFDDAGVSKSK